MFTYTDWFVHLEHHKDLLREAEKERLVKIAISTRKIEKKAKFRQRKSSRNKEVVCCQAVTA